MAICSISDEQDEQIDKGTGISKVLEHFKIVLFNNARLLNLFVLRHQVTYQSKGTFQRFIHQLIGTQVTFAGCQDNRKENHMF